MPIRLEDQHLERQIRDEQKRRGDATMSRTVGALLRERLAQIELRRDLRLSPHAGAGDPPTPALAS